MFNNDVNLKDIISVNRTYLMGIAILMIMLFHQIFINHLIVNNTTGLYGNLGVDIFFLVSGFGCIYSLQKNTIGKFYWHRLVRILPVCIMIGSLKVLLTNILPQNISFLSINAFSNLTYDWRTFLGLDLWYIRIILIYYLLAPVFNKAINCVGINYTITASLIISMIFIYEFNDSITKWGGTSINFIYLGDGNR